MLLQHPDGRTALERGDVDAWAGLDPMMARPRSKAAPAVLPQAGGQHLGRAQRARGVRQENPEIVRRVLAVYEEARKYALANPEELKKMFIAATKLPDAVVDRQLGDAPI